MNDAGLGDAGELEPGGHPQAGGEKREAVATGAPDDRARRLLACPACRGGLDFEERAIRCRTCGAAFPQPDAPWINLMVEGGPAADAEWERRQLDMEGWYGELLESHCGAEPTLRMDHEPFSRLLSQMSGTILDLGGGSGAAGRYLQEGVEHVVLDPSLEWIRPEWAERTAQFLHPAPLPAFIRGVGEQLPFFDAAFDGVLALWSLNHAIRPDVVLGEVARVLRPGGRFLAVLEDMQPGWLELPRAMIASRRPRFAAHLLKAKLGATLRLRPWPVCSDHVPITDAAMRAWARPNLVLRRRVWIDRFLAHLYERSG